MKKKYIELIFFILLTTLMVMSLNFAILDSTGMDIKPMKMVWYTIIIVVTAAILIRYPVTLIAVVVIAICGGIYAFVKKLVIPADLLSYFNDFFLWLPKYIAGYEVFDTKFSAVFAVLYILFVTLILSLLVFNRRGYGVLLAIGAGAFAFFWYIYVERARLYLCYYLFAALILYSYDIFDKKKIEWIKTNSNIDKNIEVKWVFNSLLIVFVSVFAALFLTPDIKPMQWTWLNENAVRVFPFIQNWRSDSFDDFDFAFGSTYNLDRVGYKTSRLGGAVKLDQKVMLTVETRNRDHLYLRGTVRDYYTGDSWRKTNKSNVQYDMSMEIALPFSKNVKTFEREIKITPQKLITSTIFAPNALNKVQNNNGMFFVDQDGEAYFSKILPKRSSYTVTSVIPYIDLKMIRAVDTSKITSDLYKQLPDNVPDRVRQLALDITRNYHNDYDKAKAIEQYLRQNYQYTLNPSELPAGAEFVDYFLFDGKEGYCTYFATSLAVLLREAGIPCRYVEGFLAKYDGASARNVLGTDAHAWVEVNFGEYGWINFEATPAYPLVGFSAQGEVPTEEIPEPTPNEPNTPMQPMDIKPRDNRIDGSEDDEITTNSSSPIQVSIKMGIILGILAILLIRILSLVLFRAYLEAMLKKAIGRQYSVRYFEDIVRYLKKLNVVIEKDETMREYWHKVRHTLADQYGEGDTVIRVLEQSRYGMEEISESDQKQLEEYRKMLRKLVTARLGTIKAFIAYYIVGL